MKNSVRSLLHGGSGGIVVEIECHLSNGLPAIVIVGLGNKAIDESKERVRSAFASSKLALPRKRITINLAPADVPKESASFDLPIVAAILQSSGQIKHTFNNNEALIGEVGLDGSLRPVRGIIGKLLAGVEHGITTFYIPKANVQQAILVPDINIVAVESVGQLYGWLNDDQHMPVCRSGKITDSVVDPPRMYAIDEVAGQEQAKRALEIAAAGGHNLLLSGPPGTGKSMLAKALPDIMPPLSHTEILEITHLYSLATNTYDQLITARPFRAPHHSASHMSIVGGGTNIRPGEISLSHRGVLLFDELPEFSRTVLESLRQPLEDRTITITRAKETAVYPADFLFIGTANPCPCGYYGSAKACQCSIPQIMHYRQKISGPILDRIDLFVEVDAVKPNVLLAARHSSTGKHIRDSVLRGRAKQRDRYDSFEKLNANMSNADIREHARLTPDAQKLLNEAAEQLEISARGYMRVIKVSRTIADLAGENDTGITHVAEALQYRPKLT